MKRGFSILLVMLLSCGLHSGISAATFGEVDPTFAPVLDATPGDLNGMAAAPDGKFFIWGAFHEVSGGRRCNLARLNADGQLDTAFNAGLSPLSKVLKAAVQSDNKVLVQGELYRVDGTVLAPLVRFNEDGSVDPLFQLPANVGEIHNFQLLPSQKVILSGLLQPANNVAATVLLRLQPDGGIDPGFNSAARSGYIYDVKPVANDKVLIYGTVWKTITSNPTTADTLPNVFRLNEDGTKDATYDLKIYTTESARKLGHDGRYYNYGTYPAPNGLTSQGRISRSTPDGEADASWNVTFPEETAMTGLYPLPGGKLIADILQPNGPGPWKRKLVRVGSDGAIEQTYFPEFANVQYANLQVMEAAAGAIVVAEQIEEPTYQSTKFLKLASNGMPDGAFAGMNVQNPRSYKGAQNLSLSDDGKIYVQRIQVAGLEKKHPHLIRLQKSGAADGGFTPAYQGTHALTKPTTLTAGGVIVEAVAFNDQYPTLLRLSSSGTLQNTLSASAPRIILSAEQWTAFPEGRVLLARGQNDGINLSINEYSADLAKNPAFVTEQNPTFIISKVKPVADGRLLVEYRLTTGNSLYLRRMLTNGQWDNTFNTHTSENSELQLRLADAAGRVYRSRREWVGVPRPIPSPANVLMVRPDEPALERLKANGTPDTTFTAALTRKSYVNHVWVQKDGKVLVAGKFFSADGTKVSTLARLLPDGALDESFAAPAGEVVPINCLAVEADGNILVGGNFDRIGGVARAGLARLASVEQPELKGLTFPGSWVNLQVAGNLGRTWIIQTSTDLIEWTPAGQVTTGTSTSTVNSFVPLGGARFFRMILAPTGTGGTGEEPFPGEPLPD